MGRLPEGKSPQIQYLRPHHRSMARTMATSGLTPMQLATAFGFSPGQITRIINSPLFMAELARIEGAVEVKAVDVSMELKMLQPRAMEIVAEDMFAPGTDRKLRNQTAFEVLDRTGFGKKQEPQRHLHLHAHQEADVREMPKEDLYREVLDLAAEE